MATGPVKYDALAAHYANHPDCSDSPLQNIVNAHPSRQFQAQGPLFNCSFDVQPGVVNVACEWKLGGPFRWEGQVWEVCEYTRYLKVDPIDVWAGQMFKQVIQDTLGWSIRVYSGGSEVSSLR